MACAGQALVGYSQTTPTFTLGEVVLQNIGAPWGMAFLNNNELLFTEKAGKLWRVNLTTQTRTEITGLPTIGQNGQGGLLDVALHPDFSQNNYVYLTYAVTHTGGHTTALGRGVLNGNQLQNFTELFRALPAFTSGNHFGSRIAFDNDKYLYISVGDRGTGTNAQNKNVHAGKILRFNADGTVPTDNPFVGDPNAKPEIYSWGHRNVQGMALNPANGQIYAHEHGPQGGDELNVIKKGANYGWPAITFGIDYDGSVISTDTAREGMEQPLTYWRPSIAPSGMVFIRNNQAANEADVLIGALVQTHLHYVRLVDNKKVAFSRNLDGYGRFRDVEQAPNGQLYALTESPGRLIRLNSNLIVTSLDNEEAAGLASDFVSPNPSAGSADLSITLSSPERVSVKVLNLDGSLAQQVSEQAYPSGTHRISLQGEQLAKGMYTVEIVKGGRRSAVKWIKQ